ncbi:glycosyltransferase [Aurantibacter sp.]|uniref:glycosyltransferase n=1 Tax=Aurantibacter sp. TaxID=2807103 RepID=UPI0035C85E5E
MIKNKTCLVLLATYNGENYIREQLNSILAQKKVDLNILVSDDISTDNTIRIIKSFNDKRIKILPKIGKFGSASQNFFRLFRDADISGYDYFAFADQDDIWNINKVYLAINQIQKNEVDAYSSNVLAFWSNGKKKIIDKAQPQRELDFIFSSPGPGCTHVFNSKLAKDFKNHLSNKIKITKDIELHDWLIYAFARIKGYRWYIDSKVSMKYRQHKNNEFGANSGLKTFLNRWKKSRDGWYRKQILKTAEFCEFENEQIRLLKRDYYIDRIKLIKNLLEYRRKTSDALFLGLTLIIPKIIK